MIVTKEQVERAFEKGGFTINERFKECGFIYFPVGAPYTKENPDQGRVFWNVVPHKYPDTEAGRLEKQLDASLGRCQDGINVSMGWGRPPDEQMKQIEELLWLYVIFRRQAREEWNYSLADLSALRELEEAEV